jgi:hypothetical protein
MPSRKPRLRFLSKDWASPISLTNEEVQLLKLLKAAGNHGRTNSNLNSRSGVERLVKIGYVMDHSVTLDTVLYQITKRGDRALTNATGDAGR